MYFCNKCDESFTRKDNLVRHHRKLHDDEASLASLLRNLGYTSKSTSYEPKQKRARTNDSESSEGNETNDETDDENETDDESIASSRDETAMDDGDESSAEDIEEQLNDEDESTPSLYPLRNVWALIEEDAEKCYEGDVVNAYIDQVRLARQLKSDPVHKKVMETMQGLQARDLNMDFEEALVKAANRRKHIIEQAADEAKDEGGDAEKKNTL